MKLARVLGTVVATEHHPDFDGQKMLVCQPLDEHGADAGAAIVAVDRVQAGKGDHVLLLREGNGARQIFGRKKMCIRSVVVGVVDAVDAPHRTP